MLKKMRILVLLLPALPGCIFVGRGHFHHHHNWSSTIDPVQVKGSAVGPLLQGYTKLGAD